jgi:hypothetical protein
MVPTYGMMGKIIFTTTLGFIPDKRTEGHTCALHEIRYTKALHDNTQLKTPLTARSC